MVYSKEVTAIILSDWAKGATAEETIVHLKKIYGKSPCLNSIYNHRNSLTTQNLIDELLRQQEQDITQVKNKELKLKYRNELLKILLPFKAEIVSVNKNLNLHQTEVHNIIELSVYQPGQTEPKNDESTSITPAKLQFESASGNKVLSASSAKTIS